MLEIGVFGQVTAWVDGRPAALGGHQQRAVLAMLVAARGRVVPADRIVEQLWAGRPPQRPSVSLQAYVSRLRRALEPERPPRTEARVLVSAAGGYALRLPAEAVDAWDFERRLRDTRDGLPAERLMAHLREALERWRAAPYEEFADEEWARADIARLQEAHRDARELVVATLLRLGRPTEAVPLAQELTASDPWRGEGWRLLGVALWSASRSTEALAALRGHRRRLADELGLDPEPALVELERAILAQRQDVLAAQVGDGSGVRPAQLPRSPDTFTAREPELAALAGTGPLTVISGAGGVGKTTLAVRWAHRVAERFPDGQLFADLRGYGPEEAPAAAADVLFGFLTALGVPDRRVPEGEAARAALFRSVLAGRRVLVVLDNAHDSAQVRPLLPGEPGCTVVVTGRTRLDGLAVTEGARALQLDGFHEKEAREYLRGRLGTAVTDADPAALEEVVARCGGLPLALAVVCARVLGDGARSLTAVAAELREESGLDAFALPGLDHDLRAVFSWSYRRLPPAAAALFRRLALHPGPDVTVAVAVSAAGDRDRPGTRAALRILRDAHLLWERRKDRYAFHDLVRSYAVELAHREDTVDSRHAVERRLVEHHLHSALRAADVYVAYRRSEHIAPPSPSVCPEEFTEREAALAWMAAEYDNATAVAGLCDAPHLERFLGPLVWAIGPFQQDVWLLIDDSLALARRALAVAERDGDAWWTGFLTYIVGRGHLLVNRVDEARPYLERTVEAGRATGDPLRLAHGLLSIAVCIIGKHRIPTREQAFAAYPYGREAVQLYRGVDNPTGRMGVANALHPVAWYHHYLGDGRARELFEEAVTIREAYNNPHAVGSAVQEFGLYHRACGDTAAAIDAFERAVELFADAPDLRIDPLVDLYSVYVEAGDSVAAQRVRAAALLLLENARHPEVPRIERALGVLSS
ncbi:SARP family transcriptional regulator [Virgisporangium aliadipatigenens]|uniref:SARP family transcriptional regulator n=1 Tax=Virgisporangium aliadipatigenens TaxID=741659 RepID=A0A8J3YHI0_9ACTN|nr:BTAD domain-containing putative transcriptional regulator [Virgisporangium aliadipatigenens]GIJ44063.1 SARP family transcriptional regulator [Virgisporangium aliadipatigenens]